MYDPDYAVHGKHASARARSPGGSQLNRWHYDHRLLSAIQTMKVYPTGEQHRLRSSSIATGNWYRPNPSAIVYPGFPCLEKYIHRTWWNKAAERMRQYARYLIAGIYQ